jgi:hypothetical protein
MVFALTARTEALPFEVTGLNCSTGNAGTRKNDD